LETDEAPLNAGEPAEAEGLAMVAFMGLRTLIVLLAARPIEGYRMNLRVDNVDDTVGNEDIRGDNTGTVDKNLSVSNGDGQVCTVSGLEGSSVGQRAAVAHSTGNDVVGKDAGYLLSGKVGKAGTDSLESSVVGSEDGNILGGVDGVDEVGRVESAGERSQTCGKSGLGGGLGQSKDSVNDVDYTTGEVNIGSCDS
jgi:hypothetical protein